MSRRRVILVAGSSLPVEAVSKALSADRDNEVLLAGERQERAVLENPYHEEAVPVPVTAPTVVVRHSKRGQRKAHGTHGWKR